MTTTSGQRGQVPRILGEGGRAALGCSSYEVHKGIPRACGEDGTGEILEVCLTERRQQPATSTTAHSSHVPSEGCQVSNTSCIQAGGS
jgi:hypothetical protein